MRSLLFLLLAAVPPYTIVASPREETLDRRQFDNPDENLAPSRQNLVSRSPDEYALASAYDPNSQDPFSQSDS